MLLFESCATELSRLFAITVFQKSKLKIKNNEIILIFFKLKDKKRFQQINLKLFKEMLPNFPKQKQKPMVTKPIQR